MANASGHISTAGNNTLYTKIMKAFVEMSRLDAEDITKSSKQLVIYWDSVGRPVGRRYEQQDGTVVFVTDNGDSLTFDVVYPEYDIYPWSFTKPKEEIVAILEAWHNA